MEFSEGGAVVVAALRNSLARRGRGGIRGYRAVIDPASVGRSFEVLVDITLDSQDGTSPP